MFTRARATCSPREGERRFALRSAAQVTKGRDFDQSPVLLHFTCTFRELLGHINKEIMTSAPQSGPIIPTSLFGPPTPVSVGGLCQLNELCQDLSSFHRDSFKHSCRHGLSCRFFHRNDAVHLKRYLHDRSACERGRDCPALLDAAHSAEFCHFPSSESVVQATATPTTPCRHGAECRMLQRGDAVHCSRFWHPLHLPTLLLKRRRLTLPLFHRKKR